MTRKFCKLPHCGRTTTGVVHYYLRVPVIIGAMCHIWQHNVQKVVTRFCAARVFLWADPQFSHPTEIKSSCWTKLELRRAYFGFIGEWLIGIVPPLSPLIKIILRSIVRPLTMTQKLLLDRLKVYFCRQNWKNFSEMLYSIYVTGFSSQAQ